MSMTVWATKKNFNSWRCASTRGLFHLIRRPYQIYYALTIPPSTN